VTYAFPLDAAHPGTIDDAKALVGGKAANLGVMARDLGLPVPPGFAITTSTCREFLAKGWPTSKPPSGVASATRVIRSWSASARVPPFRCPG
jgi:phosphoenolpyruvate synthase/pyruvate phosphate dikinase